MPTRDFGGADLCPDQRIASANLPPPSSFEETTWPTIPADRHEATRGHAEEIYIRTGKIPGQEVENWAQAEPEILR